MDKQRCKIKRYFRAGYVLYKNLSIKIVESGYKD